MEVEGEREEGNELDRCPWPFIGAWTGPVQDWFVLFLSPPSDPALIHMDQSDGS